MIRHIAFYSTKIKVKKAHIVTLKRKNRGLSSIRRKWNQEEIDTSDMPALTQEQLARFVPAKLLNRSLYRPVKIPVKINYDADILEWFRSFGKGYQTRINAVLRDYMLTHRN